MAFDIIGDIVILKPPLKLSPKEYVKKILEKHKFVRVILLHTPLENILEVVLI